MRRQRRPSRRRILAGIGAALVSAPAGFAIGQTAKLKLGLMLPYTGTYAQLGEAITDGLKFAIAEAGGKDQAQIDAALQAVPGIVGELLS